MAEKKVMNYEELDSAVGGTDVKRGDIYLETKGTVLQKAEDGRVLVQLSNGSVVAAWLSDDLKPQFDRIRAGDLATVKWRPDISIIVSVVFRKR